MLWIANCANRYRKRCVASVAWLACNPAGLSSWQVLRRGRQSCVLTRTHSLPRPASSRACPSKSLPSKWHPCPPVPEVKQGESLFLQPLRNISRQRHDPSPTPNCGPSSSSWLPSPKILLLENRNSNRKLNHHRHGVRDGCRIFTSPVRDERTKSAPWPDRRN